MKKFLLTMACALGLSVAGMANVTDVIDAEAIGQKGSTSTAYAAYTYTGASGAEYSLQCATNKGTCIQLRSNNNNSGVVVTKTAGKVVKVTLTWDSTTSDARKVNVYSSNEPYSAPSDLYAQGLTYDKQIGKTDTDPSYTFTDAPAFIGLRSASSALYLTKIEIEWESGDTPAPTVAAPKVSCADNTVTITADGADAIYYTLDSTEPSNASTKYTAPFAITENTTVKAIAYKGTDKSGVTTFNATYVGTYADYAAFAAAGAGAEGTVAGPITAIYKNGSNLYTVDSKGNYMLLYDTTSDKFGGVATVANGDVFASVTGKYAPYKDLPEITGPVTLGTMTKGTAVNPEELTIEELSLDMANKYVKIVNVKIAAAEKANNYDMTDETGTVLLYNTFYNEKFYDVVTVPEGEGFTVLGFVNRYGTTLQVTPISINGGEVMETVETPVFSVASGAVAAGTTVEITCATEGAAIFYTLDNTEPTAASTLYDGALTISENTTLKAIAIKEGMIDSAVAEAMYTILDPNATEATFDFSDVKAFAPDFTLPTEASTGTDIAGMSFTNNGVTLTFAENEAANKARIWLQTGGDTQLRVYTTDSFTVSVANGMTIESIEFAFPGSNYTRLATTVGNFAVATDGKTGEWTPEETATPKATATVPFTITKNARINSMKVVYKKDPSAVENIAVDDNEAPAEYFNLQGVRVANPTPGLYIVRQGNKTSKVLVK